MTAFRAQVATELRLTSRQGEQLLVSLGIPLLLLVFFATVDVLPLPSGVDDPIEVLVPGILALAVLSTSMVSLGIGTGFERHYGVLKRLGSTPLGRPRLVAAKITAVTVVEVIQVGSIIGVGLGLGWSPGGSWAGAGMGIVLGTAAFAGIGLLLAGTLSGMGTLAAANGLYLILLLTGGMVFPLEELPSAVVAAARATPAAALTEVMNGTVGPDGAAPGWAWGVLVGWAVAAPVAAAATFRWES